MNTSHELPNRLARPATVALLTGLAATGLTIAATLVTIAADAPKQALFSVLLWIMFVSGGLAVAVSLWVLAIEVRVERQQLRIARSLDRHVPNLLKFNSRMDEFEIYPGGDAVLNIKAEGTVAEGSSVPWLAFPMTAEVQASQEAWAAIRVETLEVDGIQGDTINVFVPRERRTMLNDPYLRDRVIESGVVRVPVSLGPHKRRCRFAVRIRLVGAFTEIANEEMCYTDVPYVTGQLTVAIKGSGGLQLSGSPFAPHRVEAFQVGMELIDVLESQEQSAHCDFSASLVEWSTTDAKLGYRYRIPVRQVLAERAQNSTFASSATISGEVKQLES